MPVRREGLAELHNFAQGAPAREKMGAYLTDRERGHSLRESREYPNRMFVARVEMLPDHTYRSKNLTKITGVETYT